jgi:hypothetical protein
MKGMAIALALATIGRRFIGGYKTRDARYYLGRNRYRPHIGAKQIAKYSKLPEGFMDAASRRKAGE